MGPPEAFYTLLGSVGSVLCFIETLVLWFAGSVVKHSEAASTLMYCNVGGIGYRDTHSSYALLRVVFIIVLRS